MKKHIVSVILAAFFAVVSVSFGQVGSGVVARDKTVQKLESLTVEGKKLEVLNPPKTFKLEKIEAYENTVRYQVAFKNNSTNATFVTDPAGKLIAIYAVVDDHIVASENLMSEGGHDTWEDKFLDSLYKMDVDPAIWAKFFAEKVSPPVRVTIADSYQVVTLEKSGNEMARRYEFVGNSYDSQSKRQVLVREVGTKNIRNFSEDQFVMLPPEDRPFYLGSLGGKFCAVESLTMNDKSLTVIAVRIGGSIDGSK